MSASFEFSYRVPGSLLLESDVRRRKAELRRRNGAVIRHDRLFRKAFTSSLALSINLRLSCMRLSYSLHVQWAIRVSLV